MATLPAGPGDRTQSPDSPSRSPTRTASRTTRIGLTRGFQRRTEGQRGFAAAELSWGGQDSTLQFGAWVNSADHERWDGTGTTSNYGLYGVLNWPLGGGTMGARIGLANPDVAEAENFVSLAWEYPLTKRSIAIGVGHASASDEFRATDPGNVGNLTQAEANARFDILKELQVTQSVQVIRNSGLLLLRSETGFDRSAVVAGLRVNYIF